MFSRNGPLEMSESGVQVVALAFTVPVTADRHAEPWSATHCPKHRRLNTFSPRCKHQRGQALLRRLADEHGQTLVVVTHDAGHTAMADRLITPPDGRQSA